MESLNRTNEAEESPGYLEMNVAIFQLRPPDQRPLYRAKLGALGNPSFGEHSSKEPIYVEDQRQTRSCPSEHRPVRDRMQGAMLWAHRRMGIVTLFTPCKRKNSLKKSQMPQSFLSQ